MKRSGTTDWWKPKPEPAVALVHWAGMPDGPRTACGLSKDEAPQPIYVRVASPSNVTCPECCKSAQEHLQQIDHNQQQLEQGYAAQGERHPETVTVRYHKDVWESASGLARDTVRIADYVEVTHADGSREVLKDRHGPTPRYSPPPQTLREARAREARGVPPDQGLMPGGQKARDELRAMFTKPAPQMDPGRSPLDGVSKSRVVDTMTSMVMSNHLTPLDVVQYESTGKMSAEVSAKVATHINGLRKKS